MLLFYVNPWGALFKLSQRGSIIDYLTEFERLANRIVGLPTLFLLSCFISALAPKICREVQALQPLSLLQATALTRLQEDKINDHHRPFRQRPYLSPPRPSHPFPNPNPSKPKPPFIQRTLEETTFCCDKGLCYNYDEKWSASHRCKGHVLLLITDPFESPNTFLTPSSPTLKPDPDPSPEPGTPPTSPHISIHALADLLATDTFRVLGTICHSCLTVLVDNGNTHNFIQSRVAKFLNL